jgi:hypothetical protein
VILLNSCETLSNQGKGEIENSQIPHNNKRKAVALIKNIGGNQMNSAKQETNTKRPAKKALPRLKEVKNTNDNRKPVGGGGPFQLLTVMRSIVGCAPNA